MEQPSIAQHSGEGLQARVYDKHRHGMEWVGSAEDGYKLTSKCTVHVGPQQRLPGQNLGIEECVAFPPRVARTGNVPGTRFPKGGLHLALGCQVRDVPKKNFRTCLGRDQETYKQR